MEKSQENPYIETTETIINRDYNPLYGDDRVCVCGHPYHRHFDSYEEMRNVGCKYCGCFNFIEKEDFGKLIERLLTYVNPDVIPIQTGAGYVFTLEQVNEFATLIVNECANSLGKHSSQLFGNDEWLEECQDNIKEYFKIS